MVSPVAKPLALLAGSPPPLPTQQLQWTGGPRPLHVGDRAGHSPRGGDPLPPSSSRQGLHTGRPHVLLPLSTAPPSPPELRASAAVTGPRGPPEPSPPSSPLPGASWSPPTLSGAAGRAREGGKRQPRAQRPSLGREKELGNSCAEGAFGWKRGRDADGPGRGERAGGSCRGREGGDTRHPAGKGLRTSSLHPGGASRPSPQPSRPAAAVDPAALPGRCGNRRQLLAGVPDSACLCRPSSRARLPRHVPALDQSR